MKERGHQIREEELLDYNDENVPNDNQKQKKAQEKDNS